MRALRILLLVALALLAIRLWLARLLAPEAVAERLSQLVEQTTGLALALHQAPRLALFPSIALQLGAGELRDHQGHRIARFERLIARLGWMRLFTRPVELEALELDGALLELFALARHQPPVAERSIAPPRLPGVRFPIAIHELRLLDAEGLEILRLNRLTAPPLREHRAWTVEAEGEAPGDPPVRFRLLAGATPTPRSDGIDWEDAALTLALPGWIELRLGGALHWRESSQTWTLAGEARLDERLTALLAAAAGPGRLTCAGAIDTEGAQALAVLTDAAEATIARLRWTAGRDQAQSLRLALPRLVLAPVEVRGVEIEWLPESP